MDRIWQWAWDRYGARYSWAIFTISILTLLPVWLVASMIITAYEHSNHYFETAALTVVAVPVLVYAIVLPGLGRLRSVERWAAAQEVDRATALADTYRYVRETFFRAWSSPPFGPLSLRSLSVRSPERPGGGSSSTAYGVPSSEPPPSWPRATASRKYPYGQRGPR